MPHYGTVRAIVELGSQKQQSKCITQNHVPPDTPIIGSIRVHHAHGSQIGPSQLHHAEHLLSDGAKNGEHGPTFWP